MAVRSSARLLACAFAAFTLPAHGAGLQPGWIEDSLEDVMAAANGAQDVADLVKYESRIVVLDPKKPDFLPLSELTVPTVAPQPYSLAVQTDDNELVGLYVLVGLAALPLLLGGLGGSGGGSGLLDSPFLPQPGVPPSGLHEQPKVPVAPPSSLPPAIPEPATWAMLLLGFGAVGGSIRRSAERRPADRRRTALAPPA